MSDKYSGNYLNRLIGIAERVMGGRDAGKPTDAPEGQPEALAYDYSAEFDQSPHARSIEHSREVSAGCWDAPSDSGDE